MVLKRNRSASLKTTTTNTNTDMNENNNNLHTSSSPVTSYSSGAAANRRNSIATTNYDNNIKDNCNSEENDGDSLVNICPTDSIAFSAAISAMSQSEVLAEKEDSSGHNTSGGRGDGRLTEGRSNSSFVDSINSCTEIPSPSRGSSRRNNTFQSLTCDTSSSCDDDGHPTVPPPAAVTTKVSIVSCDYSYHSTFNTTTTPKEEVTAAAGVNHTDNESLRWTSCSSRSELAKKNANYINSNIEALIPCGYKLRDEFVCPITRELIMDPVIAADGHT
jgi:hypothetical protein